MNNLRRIKIGKDFISIYASASLPGYNKFSDFVYDSLPEELKPLQKNKCKYHCPSWFHRPDERRVLPNILHLHVIYKRDIESADVDFITKLINEYYPDSDIKIYGIDEEPDKDEHNS